MAYVTCVGDKCTGHGGFSPRPSIEGQSKMRVGGKPVVCVGDAYDKHTDGDSTHGGVLSEGSSSLSIGGKAVGRVGDAVSCGSTVAEGNSKFNIAR